MKYESLKQKIKYCPYDGALLEKGKFCGKCDKPVNIQRMPPRKPRNFHEKMPEGIEDNHTDDTFLKGLAHKSKLLWFDPCR